MPFDSSLESTVLGLSLVKFSLQTDIFSLSYGLYTACPWNSHSATLPIFDSNLELCSTVRPEKFILECVSMGKSTVKVSELLPVQKWRFI